MSDHQSGPNAPLLASQHENDRDYEYYDHDHDQDLEQPINPEPEYSEGWFIWALAFSAGISGLLFGYEYV